MFTKFGGKKIEPFKKTIVWQTQERHRKLTRL